MKTKKKFNVIQFAIIVITGTAFFFGIFCFYFLSFNPSVWSGQGRFLFSTIESCIFLISAVLSIDML